MGGLADTDSFENISVFTEHQIDDMNEFFDSKAKPVIVNEDQLILVTIPILLEYLELKKFHRRQFHYPSYNEVMSEYEKLKTGTRFLNKEQFVELMSKWVLRPQLKHEVLLAFKVFDTEKRDYLDLQELEQVVTQYGDILNESEWMEMKRDADNFGDGIIRYSNFIESMFTKFPQLENLIKAYYIYRDADEDPSIPPLPVVPVEVEPEPEPEPVVEIVVEPPPAPKKSKNK